MFTFIYHGLRVVMDGASPTPFMWFFVYVWAVWTCKAVASRRYRPWSGEPHLYGVTVLVPVYNERRRFFAARSRVFASTSPAR